MVVAWRPRTGFDKISLERLEQLFIKTVGNEKEIRREEFKKIVTSKNPFFTERVFQIFDKDNSGSISLQVRFRKAQATNSGMLECARNNPNR
ncbi:hypothetical protein RP20_CCG014936 [Aedes albopictus]|nr:hypothetical protein RP20_CCG014936 [Aedes albopictus]